MSRGLGATQLRTLAILEADAPLTVQDLANRLNLSERRTRTVVNEFDERRKVIIRTPQGEPARPRQRRCVWLARTTSRMATRPDAQESSRRDCSVDGTTSRSKWHLSVLQWSRFHGLSEPRNEHKCPFGPLCVANVSRKLVIMDITELLQIAQTPADLANLSDTELNKLSSIAKDDQPSPRQLHSPLSKSPQSHTGWPSSAGRDSGPGSRFVGPCDGYAVPDGANPRCGRNAISQRAT